MQKLFGRKRGESKEVVNPAYAVNNFDNGAAAPTVQYQGIRVQVNGGASSNSLRSNGSGGSSDGILPKAASLPPPKAEPVATPEPEEEPEPAEPIEIILKRNEPNVRAGIVFDQDYPSRAIVKSVAPGSLAAKTHHQLSRAMWIKTRDEVFAIDGVTVTSAKHAVQLIRQRCGHAPAPPDGMRARVCLMRPIRSRLLFGPDRTASY